MTPLRTLIVGCGAVAQRLYLKPLRRLERRGLLRIVGLVDPAARHAEAVGSRFPEAARYVDLDEALQASVPELTLILSPAHLHCGQTIRALRHGSHVLCEKPMAVTERECVLMNDAAAAAGRILAVGMIRRFFPAYTQFRSLIQEQQLGTLTSFEYREGHKFEWDVTTPAAFRPRRTGGTGVLFDIGPHAIDHLTWTFGALKPLAYGDDALAGVESNVSLEAETRIDRCSGSVHLSWNEPQTNELRVIGTRGEAVLRIGHFDQLAVKRGASFEPQPVHVSFAADARPGGGARLSPRSYPEAVYCQIVQVVRAITLGEQPAVDGESARACVSFLETALAMARPLDVPWLPGSQQHTFRELHWSSPA